MGVVSLVLRTVIYKVHDEYHLAENNYSFDALQAYCFGINVKLYYKIIPSPEKFL